MSIPHPLSPPPLSSETEVNMNLMQPFDALFIQAPGLELKQQNRGFVSVHCTSPSQSRKELTHFGQTMGLLLVKKTLII